jgi:hypothetical protein
LFAIEGREVARESLDRFVGGNRQTGRDGQRRFERERRELRAPLVGESIRLRHRGRKALFEGARAFGS